jgi:hypothetical protein
MPKMFAYPDSKCTWGYMTVCDKCLTNAPKHVDRTKPIVSPPAVGKAQICELCRRMFILE